MFVKSGMRLRPTNKNVCIIQRSLYAVIVTGELEERIDSAGAAALSL